MKLDSFEERLKERLFDTAQIEIKSFYSEKDSSSKSNTVYFDIYPRLSVTTDLGFDDWESYEISNMIDDAVEFSLVYPSI